MADPLTDEERAQDLWFAARLDAMTERMQRETPEQRAKRYRRTAVMLAVMEALDTERFLAALKVELGDAL